MYDRKKFRSAQNVTDVSFFVVMDDGSGLNLIYEETLNKMEIDKSRIEQSSTTFRGIITVPCEERDAVCSLERAFQAAAIDDPDSRSEGPPEAIPNLLEFTYGTTVRTLSAL